MLASYPQAAAATRFRILQYGDALSDRGIDIDFSPFMDDLAFTEHYNRGGLIDKSIYVIERSAFRLREALLANNYDAVFIQREASFFGPAFTERILHARTRWPIIFDFDDAIWKLDLPRSRRPLLAKLAKRTTKCWKTMQRAHVVLAGSNASASARGKRTRT
ncbi:MAG: hypothetical protein R3A47_07145 [Polyangiales bacterium]